MGVFLGMNKFLISILVLLGTSSYSHAQLELVPRTISRPSMLRTGNLTDFGIGLSEKTVLHFDNNQRLGLGTEFTSNGTKLFVNYAKFHIRHNSSGALSQSSGSAHLVLDESSFSDFARLRFINSQFISGSTTVNYTPSSRFWDIAGKSGNANAQDDRLHFFNSENGNILSLTGDEKVGINDSNPERTLDVNGSTRLKGYTETGDGSIPYKTKLIAFTSFPLSCSGGTTFNFSLGVNENRVISTDVLVQTGTSSFYPPNSTAPNREFTYRINGSRIYFEFENVAGCDFSPRGFRVWLTYSDQAIAMPVSNGPGN